MDDADCADFPFLLDLQIEEEKCKDRAFTAQQQAAMAATSKDTTVNDLTRGLVNYKYLGLDFQKADHDRLKCVSDTVFVSVFELGMK